MRLKHIATHCLLALLVRLHHASWRGIRWCEDSLEEFDMLDDIVEEVIARECRPEAAEPPVMVVRVARPTLH